MANEKHSKNITQRGNVAKSTVSPGWLSSTAPNCVKLRQKQRHARSKVPKRLVSPVQSFQQSTGSTGPAAWLPRSRDHRGTDCHQYRTETLQNKPCSVLFWGFFYSSDVTKLEKHHSVKYTSRKWSVKWFPSFYPEGVKLSSRRKNIDRSLLKANRSIDTRSVWGESLWKINQLSIIKVEPAALSIDRP